MLAKVDKEASIVRLAFSSQSVGVSACMTQQRSTQPWINLNTFRTTSPVVTRAEFRILIGLTFTNRLHLHRASMVEGMIERSPRLILGE